MTPDPAIAVEGAVITLDLAPPDGVPEASGRTDPFGFFQLSAVPLGTYRLRVTHPDHQMLEETAPLAALTHRQYVLTRRPEPPGLDLYAEVRDVATGLPLGNVPVVWEQFASRTDAAPASTGAELTDQSGFVIWRGLRPGFYRFRANEPSGALAVRSRWLSHSSAGAPDDLKELTQAHSLTFLLKPVNQSLAVTATGFDPVRSAANRPLKDIFIELTGLDPRDHSMAVMPTQSSVTDETGQALFSQLPAIPYRVRAKRLGYQPFEQVVVPDPAGDLAPVNLSLTIQPTHLFVQGRHAYQNSNLLSGVRFTLEGLAGSNTEGIQRTQSFYGFIPDARIFQSLLPGRYRLSVDGPATTGVNGVRPHFRGETYVDLPPGAPGSGGFSDDEISLEVIPALVRGRLFVAEEQGGIEFRGESGGRPLYRPRPAIGIEFIEFAADRLLPEASRIVQVDADESGEFAIPLLPGRYGIRIAGLSNHWGSHVILRDLAGAPNRGQGWPYAEVWPHAGEPPANGTPTPGRPLLVQSGHDYSLDLFVRRQAVTVRGVVDPPPGNRPEWQGPNTGILAPVPIVDLAGNYPQAGAYRDLVLGDGVATASPTSGPQRTAALREATHGAGTPDILFEFPDLTPGNYSFTVAHPRHDFPYGPGEAAAASYSIPAWNPPGVLPETDPSTPGYVVPLTTVELPGNFVAAHRRSSSVIHWELSFWNEITGAYSGKADGTPLTELAEGGARANQIQFLRPDLHPGVILVNQSTANPARSFPRGGFTYWRGFQFGDSLLWYSRHVNDGETVTHSIKVGGPENTATATQPQIRAALTLRGVSEDDPGFLIPGLIFTNPASGLILTNGQTVPDYEGTISFNGGAPGWQFRTLRTQLNTPADPELVVTYRYTRALTVAGSVTNEAVAKPVTGARIQVRDRFGNFVESGELASDATGAYALGVPLNQAQVVFVDVSAPGFFPWRQRFTPAEAVTDPTSPARLVLHVNPRLTPLPPPQITGIRYTRQGLFLPGVHRAGDPSSFLSANANGALSLEWSAEALARTNVLSLARFDTAPGNASGPSSFEHADRVSELWLIDPRAFTNSPLAGPPLSALPDAEPGDVQGLHRWLENLRTNAAQQVFFQVVRYLPAPGTDGLVRVTNGFPVWKLPPGDFKPLIVAVSQRGAIGVRDDFVSPATQAQLTGARIPRWMAFTTDLLAYTAATKATASQLESVVPLGRFLPSPSFTATIAADAQGFIDYTYGMDVTWAESMPTPTEGFLTLAPAYLGLEFAAKLEFGALGRDRRLFLDGRADVATEPLDFSRLIPPQMLPLEKPRGVFNVTAALGAGQNFPPSEAPEEFQFTATVGGGFGGTADVDLSGVTTKLGKVGLVIRLLDEAGLARVRGTLESRVGLESVTTWRTAFPPPRELDITGDTNPNVYRRHFLGGSEQIPAAQLERENEFTLCFGFGAGLKLELGTERAGASGTLRLTGADCGGRPSAGFTLNPRGDWPYLQRVRGALSGELTAFLDLWVTRVGKEWEFVRLPFDVQLGTEPVFELAPVNISTRTLSPATAAPAVFLPGRSNLLSGFYPAGSFATASESGGALLFTDVAPESGEMTLRFSRDGRAPVTIAAAPGILGTALYPRPGGGWLAAWSTLHAGQVGSPFPSSRLVAAQADPDGNWSGPALIAEFADAIHDLRFAAVGQGVGLVFLRTSGGPTATEHILAGAVWNHGDWTVQPQIVPPARMREYAVTAAGSRLLAAWTTGDGSLNATLWDGLVASTPETVTTNAGVQLALTSSPAAEPFLAHELPAGGIALLRRGSDGLWTPLGSPVESGRPADVSLTFLNRPASPLLLLNWVSGGANTTVWAAHLRPDGSAAREAFPVTASITGSHRSLRVTPAGDDGEARLLVRHEGAATDVLEFNVAFSDPPERLAIQAPALTAGGHFTFRLDGPVPSTFRVQQSSDLNTWLDVTNVANPVLPYIFVTGQPVDGSRAFRVVSP